MRPTQYHRYIVNGANLRRRTPGLFDLGCIGCDADQVRPELLDEIGQWLVFDVGIEYADIIATPLGNGGQISQPQVWRGSGIDRQTEPRIDQRNSHYKVLPYKSAGGIQITPNRQRGVPAQATWRL